MKRTFQPKKAKRQKNIGFLARMKNSPKVIQRRRLRGSKKAERVSVCSTEPPTERSGGETSLR